MRNFKVKSITIIPAAAHDLIISSVCNYYDIDKSELIDRAKTREQSRRKGILFYVLKVDGQMSSAEMASVTGSTRQSIDQAIERTEGEINIYLQSACDCRNIRAIFASLQKEQMEWLNRDLQPSNTKL